MQNIARVLSMRSEHILKPLLVGCALRSPEIKVQCPSFRAVIPISLLSQPYNKLLGEVLKHSLTPAPLSLQLSAVFSQVTAKSTLVFPSVKICFCLLMSSLLHPALPLYEIYGSVPFNLYTAEMQIISPVILDSRVISLRRLCGNCCVS